MQTTVQQRLTTFICREFLGGDEGEVPGPDEQLIGSVIDSVAVHELIVFIDQEFGVELEDDDLQPENFASLASLAGFVESKTTP